MDINEKAKKWADAEYSELRYEKCERKNFVFTFRELREMGKQAYIAGYNEANEWHKPSEKLPEECSLVLAYLFDETEPTICEYVVSDQWECLPKRFVFCSNDQVRKWKEIEPPKEIKENE